jgi:hypothetical protein
MRRMPLLILLVCTLLAVPATVQAATADQVVGPPITAPASQTVPPPGFKTTARQALHLAMAQPKVRAALRGATGVLSAANVWQGWRWEVDFDKGDRRYASVDIGPDGRILKVWTGVDASSYMARGGFNDVFPRVWIWLPFGLLFLIPFVDPRRLRRLIHLDLLALLSFGISFAYFNATHGDAAVRWFYPPLLYGLVRMLFAGFRPRRGNGRLVPYLPTTVLIVGIVAMFGARVALNVTSDRVMDIGYASVVGANRITHKEALYVDNDQHGDTYGPVNYIAYIPFELALPYKGVWDDLPAAHAATIFFDLMTLLGLFLLGRQMRAGPEGRRLGLALAWAWAAFPFTLLGVMENTNDGLVAMFLVWALVAFRSAAGRGAMLGLATAAKFTPGALLLVLARGTGDRSVRANGRTWAKTIGACVGIFLFSLAVYWPKGGFAEFWNCTLGYQLGRFPDLSLWTIYHHIGWTQTALEAFGIMLMLAVAVWPGGKRTLGQVAALAAAITIALQLPAGHWFYFYIMWFLPLTLVALFAEHRDVAVEAAASVPEDEAAPVALPGVGLGGRLAA